ncbi:MAG: hypothetical protein ABIP94_05295 [Planctomycetota bacterium]
MRLLAFAFLSLSAAPLAAQSPLTTTFINNNAGGVGGGVYFDLNVTDPLGITITGIDLNLSGTGSVDIYTTPGTRTGVQTTQSAWTLVSSGAVTSAVPGAVSPVAITAFPLAFGSHGIALAGVNVAHSYTNGTGTNQTFVTAQVTLNAGEASNLAFAGGLFTPRVVNTNIYFTGGTNGTVASNTTIGQGCIRSYTSFYELFAAPSSFDLNNTSALLAPSGGGYVAVPAGAFLAQGTTSAPQVLALLDDSEVTVPLTAMTFPANTGSATALTVCSNGYVSVASGNGTAYTPVVATMLNAPQTGFWCWHDFNPTLGGTVEFEQSAAVSVVTFNNVRNYLGTSTTDDSTFQMQFYANGNVVFAWQTMSANGTAFLVGYSPGGSSADPGNTDISVALPLGSVTTGSTDAIPLTLTASTRPLINTNWNFSITNIPATGVLGVRILGGSDPGLNDLGFLGLPGCGLRASLDLLTPFVVSGSSQAFSVAIPNLPAYIGFHVYMSSAVFQVPPVNTFGAITSNGINGLLGNL